MWGQRLSSANTCPSCQQSSTGRSAPCTVIICFSFKLASDAARKNPARFAPKRGEAIMGNIAASSPMREADPPDEAMEVLADRQSVYSRTTSFAGLSARRPGGLSFTYILQRFQ